MQRKIEISDLSKVVIKWKTTPLEYSREKENSIISKMAQKYSIPKDNIRVDVQFTDNNKSVNVDNETVENINSPIFQQNLFRNFIKEKGIDGCDIDKIIEIDNSINNLIDYEQYDKNKRYCIKWIKWDNFMSYGPNNYIDFTDLKGLVLLTSNPSNQGGKSTFSVDLIRFLLFGKVTSRESDWTLSKIFNKHIPEATEVVVEGCVSIDGDDYIIKRIVSRPSLERRTEKSKVVHKVNYYKLVNDEYITLEDEENEGGTSSTNTNKIIKESIGNEKDFDLMICVNSDNLKGLISLKDTERGRLLTRWIGLLPLEEKDKIAREMFNKQVSPRLLLNKYDKNELTAHNESLIKENDELDKELKNERTKISEIELKLTDLRKNRDILLESKLQIDNSLINVDVNTLEKKKENITESGINKSNIKENHLKRISEIGEVSFNQNEYEELIESEKKISIQINTVDITIKNLKKEITTLKNAEKCAYCGAPLKGVDNTAIIESKNVEISDNTLILEKLSNKLSEIIEKRKSMDENRTLYNEKSRLELMVAKIEVDIDNLRKDYREVLRVLKDIQANKEAIEKNNKIDIALNNIDVNIRTEEKILQVKNNNINEIERNIEINKRRVQENEAIVEKICNEEKLVFNWRTYLEMVGKNGISKMVLRNTLPIINKELSQMLNGVCDFIVEIDIDERQDVAFHLIHDGVVSNLSSGSGFEQTMASLALRSVLGKISSFSKLSFIIFDEILGGVSDDNYDNVKMLYDKIVNDYDFILEITHLKSIHDWHNKSIIINKENNISSIAKFN
jgi:DNA repair exonuclease SbcCD ATPase subunit